MDLEKRSDPRREAGGTASPEDQARLKEDLDDFVDLVGRRVFAGGNHAEVAPRHPVSGSNDN